MTKRELKRQNALLLDALIYIKEVEFEPDEDDWRDSCRRAKAAIKRIHNCAAFAVTQVKGSKWKSCLNPVWNVRYVGNMGKGNTVRMLERYRQNQKED